MPYIDDSLFSTYSYGLRCPPPIHDSRPSNESHADDSIHPTYDNPYSLVNSWGLQEDDEGFASALHSLACLFLLIFPEKTLEDLNYEADGRTPHKLTKDLCSIYSEELGLDFPETNTGNFSTHITKIINCLRSRRRFTTLSCEEFEFWGSAQSILQRVDSKGEKLPRGRLTTKRFALCIGYLVGKSGWVVQPGVSMGQIVQIATILPRRE